VAGIEADLDFEVAMPLIWPQKTVLYQVDDEFYQLEQTKSTTEYIGFFNSASNLNISNMEIDSANMGSCEAFFDAIDGSYCTLSAFGETGNCVRSGCKDPVYPDPYDDDGYQGQLMCGTYKPTNVLSISYSGVEASLPYSYMQRQCYEVMKLALQGVTVVESSGDNGVGGRKYDAHSGCLGPNKDVFSPRTMSNCPYVLSVGATTLTTAVKPGRPSAARAAESSQSNAKKFVEKAPTYFASGGGFSNVFATPAWQSRHVLNYLVTSNASSWGYIGGGQNFSHVGAEPGKLFNMAGRGYPDVSAIGDNYLVYLQGSGTKLSGTSVAVPIWASMLNLINEERLARGKRTVGFVHQVLVSV
jgi:tripeptidyl-peptidase-1